VTRERKIQQQELEIPPRTQRIEACLVPERVGAASAGVDGPPEPHHREFSFGGAGFGRDTRTRPAGEAGKTRVASCPVECPLRRERAHAVVN
jgi:hypothetical protein